MMPCQPITHSWTFTSLVSAFLHLGITYLLLCCSAVAFFVTKFLALFGLNLPCPCRTILVDFPSHSLSALHVSIVSRFPCKQLGFELVPDPRFDDRDVVGAVLELKSQPSCTSLSGSGSFRRVSGSTSRRQRSRFRHRRRDSLDYDKVTSGSEYPHVKSDVRRVHRSPSAASEIGTQFYADNCQDAQDSSLVPVRTVQDFGAVDSTDDNKLTYDNATSLDILNHKLEYGHGHGFDCHDDNAVMMVERSARAALCAELEQERIAAATAADEAMAMISRLQEEKASVEIEARQYQRILEEKSAYDAEEMTILKEIIVRRETEIHFLEKQLEEYRKRLQENEGLDCQVEDTQGYYDVMDSHMDPLLFIPQLDDTFDKQGNECSNRNRSDFSSESVRKQTSSASLSEKFPAAQCGDTNIDKGKESPESLSIVHDGDESGQEIQDKGVLSADDMVFSQFSKSKMVDSFIPGDPSKFPLKCDSSSEVSNSLKTEDSSNYGKRVELGIDRSCSDMADRFASLSRSPSRSVFSEQRQHSLPSVDQERLKIDGEIRYLRARLRAVQKEKERLKSPLESQEQGKTELRLLEDIAVLLREIRHLREPEKVASQASLPPLSSKETTKRRRSSSKSVGVGQSTST